LHRAPTPSTATGGYCNAIGRHFFPGQLPVQPVSRIDGISFTNSSQGGGGIFLARLGLITSRWSNNRGLPAMPAALDGRHHGRPGGKVSGPEPWVERPCPGPGWTRPPGATDAALRCASTPNVNMQQQQHLAERVLRRRAGNFDHARPSARRAWNLPRRVSDNYNFAYNWGVRQT